jgi:hypothetical protein
MPEAEAPARPPIDPEELAAFIDGRIEGERRRLMIARLAEDEDAYDLYDEVIRVRAELAAADAETASAGREPASGEESPVPRPTRTEEMPDDLASRRDAAKRRAATIPGAPYHSVVIRWLPLAAAIAIAMIGVWWLLHPTAPAPPSSSLLANLDTSGLGQDVTPVVRESLGTIYRGPATEERGAHFELGVRAFDLALAAEAGDAVSTGRWSRKIAQLIEEDVAFGIALPSQSYRDLADGLESDPSTQRLSAEIAAHEGTLQQEVDVPSEPLFEFGRWVVAVRIAAARNDRAFLASPAAERPLRRFRRADPSDTVDQQLGLVADGVGRGAQAADLAALESALAEIQDHCADGKPCLGPSID